GRKAVTVERFESAVARPKQVAEAPQKPARAITAAERKSRQTEVRRTVEEMRRRAPNYFIEDEYDE
ncbi:MAG: hypothetical protein RJB26_1108, partial [Pseudomonadota bacterium]